MNFREEVVDLPHTGLSDCTRHGARSACQYSCPGGEADKIKPDKIFHIHLKAAGGGRAYNRLVLLPKKLRRSLIPHADGKKVSIEGIFSIASTT